MSAQADKKRKFYGKLNTKNMHGEVHKIWYTKHEEPDPVQFYQLCDREWQSTDLLEKQIDNRVIVEMLLDKVTAKERNIMIMRFVQEMTLEEVGAQYGITKERIRQIENKAIRKCKYWMRQENQFHTAMREHRERMKEAV